MNFSPFDWITCEVGGLYCPPFLSRRFLFRLFRDDCSLMIYHNQHITSGPSLERKLKGGGALHSFTSIHSPIKTISAHFSQSATTSWKELLEIPSMDFPFNKELRLEQSFGPIRLRLSPFSLKITGHFIPVPRPASPDRRQYRIGDSAYHIRCPSQLVRLADRWTPEHEFSTLMVSVISSDGEEYGLFQERPWSLTAPGWGKSFFDGDPLVLTAHYPFPE